VRRSAVRHVKPRRGVSHVLVDVEHPANVCGEHTVIPPGVQHGTARCARPVPATRAAGTTETIAPLIVMERAAPVSGWTWPGQFGASAGCACPSWASGPVARRLCAVRDWWPELRRRSGVCRRERR
jgi:hypothetical protein